MANAQWLKLAGSFPPTLNKEDDPTTLKINETPASYGLEPDKPTMLKAGASPSGTTAITKQYTVTDVYNWWYNRMWRISGTQLIYGAPEYTTVYLAQELGHIDLIEGTGDLVAFSPIGQNGMIVFKSDCFFIIGNASDQNGNFQVTHINQEVGLPASTYFVELDGIVYVSNTTGLWAIAANGDTVEITAKTRNTITAFASRALKANYAKKWVIAESYFCYDTVSKTLFDYSTSGFLYTSPTLTMRRKGNEGAPFVVDAISLEVLHDNENDQQLTYQVKTNDREWNDAVTVDLLPTDNDLTRHLIPLENRQNGRTFAFRIIALSSGIGIKNIYVSLDDANKMEAYAE